jgi:hypothetical protein
MRGAGPGETLRYLGPVACGQRPVGLLLKEFLQPFGTDLINGSGLIPKIWSLALAVKFEECRTLTLGEMKDNYSMINSEVLYSASKSVRNKANPRAEGLARALDLACMNPPTSQHAA